MKFLDKILGKESERIATDSERYEALIGTAIKAGDLSEKDGTELVDVGKRLGKSIDDIRARIDRGLAFWRDYHNLKNNLKREVPDWRANADKQYAALSAAKEAIETNQIIAKRTEENLKYVTNQRDQLAASQKQLMQHIHEHRDLMPTVSAEDVAICQASFIRGAAPIIESFDRLVSLERLPEVEYQNFDGAEEPADATPTNESAGDDEQVETFEGGITVKTRRAARSN